MQPLKNIIILIVIIISAPFLVSSYKILGLFPHPGKSHVDVFVALMKGLADKGHEVTVVSHYPRSTPIPRYRDIYIDPGMLLETAVESIGFEKIIPARYGKWGVFVPLFELGKTSCEIALSNESVQKLIGSDEKFDIIIAEFFNSDCLLGFVHKFKVPLIGLSSCTIMPYMNKRFANPEHPAYIPNNFMDYSDRLTFLERVENTVMYLINELYFDTHVTSYEDKLARKYFGEDLPSLADIRKNSSLMLVNVHFTLNLPRPQVPAVVDIGGVHIRKPKKLPLNIEKWINESKEGVIYFSLGSIIKGHTFPEDKRQAFLKAFSRLPQRVLWKWENETMPGKPDNVMIQKWMPQFDILCHPNVKAFISHGGLLGTTEAVHCGVPIVVMPQFGDQFTNARALEANGGAVILQLQEATEQKVYKALKTVLDPKFREGAKELSERFRDRPMSPLDTAIYWVEYVARHKGARHMRTAAVDMPLYQYLLLDVVAFLLSIFIGVILVIYFSIRALYRVLLGKNTKKVKTH